MGYRRFVDRDGITWEVHDPSDAEWELEPVSDPGQGPVRVQAPGYQKDPFDLSAEELQRLLDGVRRGGPPPPASRRSPFRD
jgi:hypothetical protein